MCSDGWPGIYPPGSTFCCMCGAQLLQYAISPENVLIVIPQSGAPEPAPIVLDATRSLFDVNLRLECARDSIDIDGSGNAAVVLVQAGQKRTITIACHENGLESGDSVETQLIAKLVDSADAPKRLGVRVGRAPRIDASVLEFEDAVPGWAARADGSLHHQGGLAATVTDVRVEPDAGLTISGLWKGQQISSGAQVKFGMVTSPLTRSGLESSLVIDFDCAATVRVPVNIRPNDAEITWAMREDISLGIDAELTLRVRSTGRETVQIETLELSNAPSWLKMPPITFPQTASAGKPFECKLRIHGDDPTLAVGQTKVTATARCTKLGNRSGEVSVRVKRAEPFQSYVGIDFGTTSSCVAVWSDRLKDSTMLDFTGGPGGSTVPSVAYFDEDTGTWMGGLDALQAAERRGQKSRLVRSVKRLLNKPPNSHERCILMPDGHLEEPEAAAMAILRYLIRKTEERLQKKLEKVILTHPANFSDTGIRALLRCAAEGGLTFLTEAADEDLLPLRLDEPVAVALQAQRLKMTSEQDTQLVLVYDFGGGTLDVSLLEIVLKSDVRSMNVLAHKGANWLGGDDFTRRLMQLLASRFEAEKKRSLKYDVDALCESREWDEMDTDQRIEAQLNQRSLWDSAEQAKVSLSFQDQVSVRLSLSCEGNEEGFSTEVKRSDFEKAVEDLVERSLQTVLTTLNSSPQREVHIEDVDVVIASGKTSLIPIVRSRLSELCRKKLEISESFDVKECVARGACSRGHEYETPLSETGAPPLQINGLHERTNCSYGIAQMVGTGAVQQGQFVPLIKEGVPYIDAMKNVAEHTVRGQGLPRQTVPLYQHTGNTQSMDGLWIEKNPDISPIDEIEVDMPRGNRQGRIHIRMWLGKDGLLQAEASVEGSEKIFRPKALSAAESGKSIPAE